jgi:hypothetical protein
MYQRTVKCIPNFGSQIWMRDLDVDGDDNINLNSIGIRYRLQVKWNSIESNGRPL